MERFSERVLIKDMVTIMIPCYNGEAFIERLFSDLAGQTYKKLQIIFVNDGSFDRTEELALQYSGLLEAQGMQFRYKKKKNKGAASAINVALSEVQGEYVMWFDADDRMSPDHIEKKHRYLTEHPDKDLVMCTAYIYREDDLDLKSPVGTLGEQEGASCLFEDLMFERRNCTPGLFMARTKALLESLGFQAIEESRIGQNMQLLLPITAHGSDGYIPDKLFFYVRRNESHSHAKRSFEEWQEHWKNVDKTKKHVIAGLDLPAEYKQELYEKLDRHLSYQMITYTDTLMDRDIRTEEKIWKDFSAGANIKENSKGRNIYCWGMGRRSSNVVKALEKFEGLECAGFIESNRLKCDEKKGIFHRERICREEMYLIIPLGYYADIVGVLRERGFRAGADFYYPELLLLEV